MGLECGGFLAETLALSGFSESRRGEVSYTPGSRILPYAVYRER